jgi:hypothetical protein
MNQQRRIQMVGACGLGYFAIVGALYYSPIWHDPAYSWVPTACKAGFPLLAGWLFSVSKQKDSDLEKPDA